MTGEETFRTALDNLASHKLRTALTMLGMIFGVGAVIAMLSIGAGGERKALEAIGRRPEFGFNCDPSHLHWQGIDSVEFLRAFPDRIYHMHVKDAIVTLNGRTGILSSHLNFGDYRRGWDFRSPGRGGVNFEEIIRELNRIGYQGPLSVEWEDSGMDREFGAREACTFVRQKDFAASGRAFDAAFEKS